MGNESLEDEVSNLTKRIKIKFPHLTLDECNEYIESAKKSIGRSFSGFEMRDVELLAKLKMKQNEPKKEEKKRASFQSVKSLKCKMCNMDFGMEKENFLSSL